MNPYDIEQTRMNFNKFATSVVCIVVALVMIYAVCACGNEQGGTLNAWETTDETTTIETSTSDTTSEEETTVPEDTTFEETTEIPETTEPETTAPPEPEPYIVLTDSEKLILATLLRLECGGCTYECQMAVASVVLNRMDVWKKTLRETVFAQNAFSPAYLIDKKTGKSYYNPSKDGMYKICWQVVDDICANGPTLPRCVLYFRSKRYHSWATPYAKIDLLYFSYDERYD